jgi:GNAT superfamily N-acetyltransferase
VQRDSELEYTTDKATEAELPFVFRSWCRSYRTAPGSMRMPAHAFYLWQRDVIDRILARKPLVLVARDVAHDVFLYGFLVAERVGTGLVVHFCYCKRDWRGQGIARALLAEAIERIGAGASELLYSHDADRTVELSAEERAKTGRRTGVDSRLTRALEAIGMERVAVEELLRGEEAA